MIVTKINPSIIYFTHSKIRQRFTGCGKLLEETYQELSSNPLLIDRLPKIKVIYDPEKDIYYSMNNRRLWVFKKLYNENKISEIPVYMEKIKANSKMKNNQYSLIAKVVLK